MACALKFKSSNSICGYNCFAENLGLIPISPTVGCDFEAVCGQSVPDLSSKLKSGVVHVKTSLNAHVI